MGQICELQRQRVVLAHSRTHHHPTKEAVTPTLGFEPRTCCLRIARTDARGTRLGAVARRVGAGVACRAQDPPRVTPTNPHLGTVALLRPALAGVSSGVTGDIATSSGRWLAEVVVASHLLVVSARACTCRLIVDPLTVGCTTDPARGPLGLRRHFTTVPREIVGRPPSAVIVTLPSDWTRGSAHRNSWHR